MTQEAWIMNATLKNNILMGTAHDDARYVETVNACQLIADLEQLAGSDQTEIGERGINLSGGQKQRVAFARAVYSGRSVVLMDDPLSAVDSHVCTALFRQCIQGVMRDRTRVLVTHAIQFLPEADHIIVVDRCAIAFQGTYDELLQSSIDPALYTVGNGNLTPGGSQKNHGEEHVHKDDSTSANVSAGMFKPVPVPQSSTSEATSSGSLIAEEHQEAGAIKMDTVKWYIQQQGFGWFVLTLIMFAIAQALNVATQLILSWWSAHTTLVGRVTNDEQYIQWYGIFIAGAILALATQNIPFNTCMINCARDCHEWMVRSVIRCPTSYFDTTPTGRILARFSKDLANMDYQIPWTLSTSYTLVFAIMGSIGIMTYSVQYLLIMWAVLLVCFGFIFAYYGATNRAQKRLEAINRTPMAAIMNETLGGISTVRAYGMIPFYQKKHQAAMDLASRSTYSWRLSQFWLSIRIQALGAVVVVCASAVFCGVIISLDRNDAISQLPTMSLSLTNAISIAQFLGFMTAMMAELESAMSSVERVKEFCNELPQERDIVYSDEKQQVAVVSNNDDATVLAKVNEAPARFRNKNVTVAPPLPVGWPASGELRFEHASLRYRDGLPLVLRDLNLVMPTGTKVGVVGRTGSGKSTLMLALFRILEVTQLSDAESAEVAERTKTVTEVRSGSISLDGRDIATIQLQDLRSAITIIPQDPLLFAGTVRSNVDPFSQHSDERVWAVVGQVGLQERVLAATAVVSADDVAALPAMSAERVATALACPVAARGANFSVGHAQLLCLARALLKKCKLLLLDEATASVDQDTDNKIQRTIRESFAHCTVLTIAHRLQTIMDSDRVLVMEHGVAVEYDAPFTLLGKPKGAGATFRGMVEALGEEQAAVMYEIAERKFYGGS
ncbi:ABC transporter, putative [Bodo saltans]|uniref:ABC transporter, putative n=1 Tax=Bodo saltans TaxID=75058 RepID=A0A0S4IJN7_BODSA|nr:ABC transporter, putative [Bodo saltans]|eukprot:CUE58293.1 ABC transporter, putative [Bodo saltans]